MHWFARCRSQNHQHWFARRPASPRRTTVRAGDGKRRSYQARCNFSENVARNRSGTLKILAFESLFRKLRGYMNPSRKIFIGTDSGATTTKFAAVWEDGEAITTKLLQRSTSSEKGREAVISGWVAGISEFLAQNQLEWSQVEAVGLAIPGPYERYGVF